MILDLDLVRQVLRWPRGIEAPLRPFFGNLGVTLWAPYGRVNSQFPLEHGGNLNNKEIVAGPALLRSRLERWGALLKGDGHAIQGDGEDDLTTVEMALTGTFRFTVRKDLTLGMPHIKAPTHYITTGFDADLDDAVKMALREMIAYLNCSRGLAQEEAYALCSIAVDLRIAKLGNTINETHAMLPKSVFQPAR